MDTGPRRITRYVRNRSLLSGGIEHTTRRGARPTLTPRVLARHGALVHTARPRANLRSRR
eukprot:11164782-Lingulodinium_polyedra.AAC.1